MWGKTQDLVVFGGSALLALALVALGQITGWSSGALPEWGWLAFVLGVDVAHVWATLFRTYLDGEEFRRHMQRYLVIPGCCYAACVLTHLYDGALFWRILAYVALFHFIRQQSGWVAIYRSRSRYHGALDRWLDNGVVYAGTGFPVVYWHAHLDQTQFAWFVEGDFVNWSEVATAILPWSHWIWIAAHALFFIRQIHLVARTRTLQLGKIVVVLATSAAWYVGIVGTNSDFNFSVTNVIVHGVPYIALLWFYAKARRIRAPHLVGSQIVASGLGVFLGFLLLMAFIEEMAWDRLVWHHRGWLFGGSEVQLSDLGRSLIVPLLALPQVTHYVLDGILWKSRQAGPAQLEAFGFASVKVSTGESEERLKSI